MPEYRLRAIEQAGSDAAGPVAGLRGWVDLVDHTRIRGWAHDTRVPDQPQWLEVCVDDRPPVAFLANLLRHDLIDAGIGDGRSGFDLMFPARLDPCLAHRILIRLAGDAQPLPNTPWYLPAAPMAGADARAAFEAMLAADLDTAADGARPDDTLDFLLRQADRLVQARVDISSGYTALQRFRWRWGDALDGPRVPPPQPDTRPWALVVDRSLPTTLQALSMILALQTLGYRVAVVAIDDYGGTTAMAAALAAMDMAVLGHPEHTCVEDVLRRQRGRFRIVVLQGARTASAYGVMTRLHQPRARLVVTLAEAPGDATQHVSAALAADAVLALDETVLTGLRERLPGRRFEVVSADAEPPEIAGILQTLLAPAKPARARS